MTTTLLNLEENINAYFEERDAFSPDKAPSELLLALEAVFDGLDAGTLRVAEPKNGDWAVNSWVKKAILLSFRCYANEVIDTGFTRFYDKLPLKFSDTYTERFQQLGVRVVPHAIARKGSFIGKNVVLMPSYVNIGAYIDEGTMVDTWATVGSCAQIGKNVHLSGGAGIGGILEPLQAQPTIIEDNCFIGARSEVVEGVIVERNSVLSMGEITYGRIPAGSVVVPGNLPSADGTHSLYCAVIVKQVDEKTRAKVSINELLRDAETC